MTTETTGRFEIKDGPNKMALMLALFDSNPCLGHERHVRFSIADSDEHYPGYKGDIHLVVFSASRWGVWHSGYEFGITGLAITYTYTEDHGKVALLSGKNVMVAYNTGQRNGWIEAVEAES